MEVERGFVDGDRYAYDFKFCRSSDGWAQVDTTQDAWYYGIWLNPELRQEFAYCEGDTTRVTFESDEEMKEYYEKSEFYKQYMKGIDPGFNTALKQKLIEVGLEKFLH